MCGIAGLVSKLKEDGVRSRGIVSQMLELIRYRGPDQSGITQVGPVTMGMNRLSIVDLETHTIPYSFKDQVHLVYNGEIYNHMEIRSSLSSSFEFRTVSDAETVLADYLIRGERGLKDYNGMYTMAILDQKKEELLLIRDKAGEKPLYYFHDRECFAFASEMKCLVPLAKPGIRTTPSYKAYEFCTGRETMLQGISQLLPGEVLRYNLRTHSFKVESYWKIWDSRMSLQGDADSLVNQLSELVEDAIRLRTRNLAHQFGVFTGGGVDSALIACIAKPDALLYCHYDLGKAFDELDYAKLVASKLGKKLQVISPEKQDFERTRRTIAWHLDTPCTWTSFSLWMLLESLPENIKVIMSGEGADEAFAGYHRYHLLNHDEQIHKLDAMQGYNYLIQKYYGSPVERYCRLVNRWENPQEASVNQFLHQNIQFYFDQADQDVVHGMGLHDFYNTMQVLLQMSDRLCMAFSVENRSPFLDHRLLEFAFSLNSEFKIRDGVTKWILKQVALKFIPHEIANRIDKRGFSAPLNLWFGWNKLGQYNRSIYRDEVFKDFREIIQDLKSNPSFQPYQEVG